MAKWYRASVAVWIGRVISALVVLLFCSSVIMFFKPDDVKKGMEHLGYPPDRYWVILSLELLCGLLYAIPETSVLGAIGITAYLGGATASHVRMSESIWWSPVMVGVVAWIGIYLREPRLRALVPFRRV